MRPSTARALYFALQRGRHGVQPPMVHAASEILAQPWERTASYVARRLAQVHGKAAAAPEWLASRPLVDRTELLPIMHQLDASLSSRHVEHRKTSGSTGVPFHFVKDKEMTAWMDAAMWAAYAWHGIRPGDRQARLWGAPLGFWKARRRRLIDRAQNRRRLSAFNVSAQNSAAFFAMLRRFSPQYVYGYPTLIQTFVHHCLAQDLEGRDLHLRSVICTGEILLPAVRAQIQSFFDCPVVNEYGCTESGVLAFECEAGTMHLLPVAALAEILRPDGAPAMPGETGEVVTTDLYGKVLPLVRYRLHDRAALAPAVSCSCGRNLPAFSMQQGRTDSFIVTPHRGRVYDAILAYTVPTEVLRFRVYQEAVDRLHAEVVPGAGFDSERTPSECRRRWEDALGPDIHIEVSIVPDIPLTAAGKLRYFVPLPAESAG